MRSSIFVLIAVLLCSLMTSAQPRRLSPEDRARQLKDSLALTDKQVASIEKLFKDMDAERKTLMESDQLDRETRMEKMRTLQERTDAKIEALLTDSQKKKYEAMKQRRQERRGGFRDRRSRG